MKIVNGLGIGSRSCPVLAEIMMKIWEKEKIEGEGRIRKFRRYMDSSLGIWKGKREERDEKVHSMEDEKEEMKLKLEVEEAGRITFLDVELNRGKKNEKTSTKWYQKEEKKRNIL